MPAAAMKRLKRNVAVYPCRATAAASVFLLAPMRWATCTAKPVATAEQSPIKSHVEVLMRPMAAAASLPIWPTIVASMYCISILAS